MKEVLKKTIYLLILIFIIYIVINKLKKIDIENFKDTNEFKQFIDKYEIDTYDYIITEAGDDSTYQKNKENFLKNYNEGIDIDNKNKVPLNKLRAADILKKEIYYSNNLFSNTSPTGKDFNDINNSDNYKLHKKYQNNDNKSIFSVVENIFSNNDEIYKSATPGALATPAAVYDLKLNEARYKFNIKENSEIYTKFKLTFKVNENKDVTDNNEYNYSTDYNQNVVNDQEYKCKVEKILTLVTNKINGVKNFINIFYIEPFSEDSSATTTAYFNIVFLTDYPDKEPQYTISILKDNMDYLKDYLREPKDTKKIFGRKNDFSIKYQTGVEIQVLFVGNRLEFSTSDGSGSSSKDASKILELPDLKNFESIIFNDYSIDMEQNRSNKILLPNKFIINNFKIEPIPNTDKDMITSSENIYKIPTVDEIENKTDNETSDPKETSDTDKNNTFNNNPVINISYYTNNYTNEQDNSRTSIKPYNNIQDIKYNKVTGLPEKDQTSEQVDASMLRRDGAYLSDHYNNDLRFYSSNLNKILNDKNSDYCPIVMESDYGLFQANNN